MPEHQQILQSKKPDTTFQKQATPTTPIHVSNPYSIIQRARINPKSLTHADVMQLQRTIGNWAVAQLLSGIVNSSTVHEAPIQRSEIPEEEEKPMQGKFETVQRSETPEEEEPLQGKMVGTVHRQEIPEEEPPMQGKFESIQRQEIPEEEDPLQGKFENKPDISCPSCFTVPIVQRQELKDEEKPLQRKFTEIVQRQEIPEEKEPLQGNFETVQRSEIPEEEEPLQGNFESIQRQEIPEEENQLQGKMAETIQRQEIPEEEPLQGRFEGKSAQMACPSFFAAPIVQRQEMPEEEEPLQGKFESEFEQETFSACPSIPIQREKENRTGMPDNLKAGVESLSRMDMSDVMVHYNSDRPAKVGALAYTQGTDIHVASGQEKHLPHEVWHVVQQAQGRVKPTMQLKDGVPLNDDERLEHEADVMGAKSLQRTDSDHMVTLLQVVTPSMLSQQRKRAVPSFPVIDGIVQRILVIDSRLEKKTFGNIKQIMTDDAAYKLWSQLNKEENFDQKLTSKDKYYKFEKGLPEIKDYVAEVKEKRIDAPREHINSEVGSLQGKKVYNVTMNEGAGFSGTDVEILGTEGLNGCVAVIVKSKNKGGQEVYFLAHVDSHKGGNTEEIKQEIIRIGDAVRTLIENEFNWRSTQLRDSQTKITLVSNSGNDQLFIDMYKILSDIGAKFSYAHTSRIYIDINSGQYSTSESWRLRTEGELGQERTSGYGDVEDKRKLYRVIKELIVGVKNASVSPTKATFDDIDEEARQLGLSMEDPMFSEYKELKNTLLVWGVIL